MNLYLISQDENNGYDTYDSAIVCAENKNEAKKILPNSESEWPEQGQASFMYNWASSPKNVKAELIGKAASNIKKGLVLASFNAG